jgi:hypothetical protein
MVAPTHPTAGAKALRRALESMLDLLKVDRRAALGLEGLDVRLPVQVPVAMDPGTYDAIRFLCSLYPSTPGDIVRACVLRTLDPGSPAPERPDSLAALPDRTARVGLGLTEGEARSLETMAARCGATAGEVALWAVIGSLGPLLEARRPS